MFSWKEKVTDKLSHLRPDSTSSGSNLSGESDVVRLGAKDSPLGEEETSSRAEKLSSYLFSYIPASLTNFDTHKLTSIGHVTLPSLPSIPSLPSLPSLPKRWKGHGFVWSGEKFDENSDEELDQSPVEIVKVEKAPPSPLTRSLPSAIREDSSFISTPLFEFLESSLPNLVKGCEWVLLYSTLKHGISLRTLLRRSSGLPGPCLLIVGDMEGAVFGGLLEAPVNPTAKRKYQGNCQAFVFTTKYGDPRLFRATGANRYYYLCMEEMLAFGGGGHFALCLDGDLLHGTSGPSDTFGNACLAHNSEFELKNVEVRWRRRRRKDCIFFSFFFSRKPDRIQKTIGCSSGVSPTKFEATPSSVRPPPRAPYSWRTFPSASGQPPSRLQPWSSWPAPAQASA